MMTATRTWSVPGMFALLLLFLPGSREVKGQIHLSVNLTSTYDNNSFSFHDRRADVYHQLFLASSADFEGEYSYTSLYYYGALVLFRTYDARTYNQHTLGGWYMLQLSDRDDGESDDEGDQSGEAGDSDEEPDTTTITGGGEESENIPAEVFSDSLVTYLHIKPRVGGRFDHAEWDFYDYRLAGADVTLRHNLAWGVITRILYDIQFKQYPNFRQFTNLENVGGLTISRRIGTSWEFFCSARFGYKHYTETVAETTLVPKGGGKGKGKGNIISPEPVISQYSTPGTSQLILSTGFARKVGESGTVSFSLLRRTNPVNTARYIERATVAGTTEDEVFDDPYGYQASEIACILALPLPFRTRLTLEALLQRKEYPQTATDHAGIPLPGQPQRIDIRTGIGLQLSYPILRTQSGATSMAVGAQYHFARNQSNNQYHDYFIHMGGFSLTAEF